MTWFGYCADRRIALTPRQVWAMSWLEMRGKRFLIDFGTNNAVQMADRDVCRYYGFYVM